MTCFPGFWSLLKCLLCIPGHDDSTTSISPTQLAALEAALPKQVQANNWLLLENGDGFIPALHKLRVGLRNYDQHLDNASTPQEFFDELLRFVDNFVPFCPYDAAELIGAITTQSLNARDGYEKASREVYYWCVSALPLLEAFEEAMQHEHTDDAQTLLLAIYENGATIMRTVASALANTEKHLARAKNNVLAIRQRMATGSFPASSDCSIGRLTTSKSDPLLPPTKPSADALTLAPSYGRSAAPEAEVQLSNLLQKLADRIESMLLGIVFGWEQLQQTRVIETLDDERRQPNLLKFLDEATIEAYKTSASALQSTCSDFMRRHANHQAGV